MNPAVRDVFVRRALIYRSIRKFLDAKGTEIEGARRTSSGYSNEDATIGYTVPAQHRTFSMEFDLWQGVRDITDAHEEVEAGRKLRESSANIIEIAFSVGFESLRTFNRIFPKFMGTTPEKYRRQNRQ